MKYLYGFDVETTGLDPAKDVIVELALVVYRKRESGEWTRTHSYSSLVNIAVWNGTVEIPKSASEVNGITLDMLKGAPDIYEVLRNALDLLNLYPGGRFIAHSAGFDCSFLWHAIGEMRAGDYKPKPTRWTCTHQMARVMRRVGLLDVEDLHLSTLYRHLVGGHEPPTHRAVDDADAAVRVYLALEDLLPKRSVEGRAA